MKTITALDLRNNLDSVLNAVAEKHEPVTVTRANKPMVVIISTYEFQDKVLKGDRWEKLRELSAEMDVWKKKYGKETGRIDIVRSVRNVRGC